MLRYLTVLLVLFLPLSSQGSALEEYMSTVKGHCLNVNQLIIKKSLIELTQEQNCNSSFTSLLLKECPQINCTELINFWLNFSSSKSGSVIGK